MSFFSQEDAEAYKTSQNNKQESINNEERQKKVELANIREAMRYALNCYCDALRELPQFAKASNQQYIKFYTGFECRETKKVLDKYRSGLFKKVYKEETSTVFYFVDTNGIIEKHWCTSWYDYMVSDRTVDITESSLEEFNNAFQNEIEECELPTHDTYVLHGFRLFTLKRLIFDGRSQTSEVWGDSERDYYFSKYHLVECLRNKAEIEKAVKNYLLWTLSGGQPYNWPK